MFTRTLFLLIAGLAMSGHASAQSLPKPAEFYFETDPLTTRPIVAIRETGDVAIQKLLKAIERNPRAKAEHAQLAHLAMESGRSDLGKDLYTRTLTRITDTDALWRPVMWNYGWDLYRSGDVAGALAQWQLMLARRNNASWVPPTLALVLWSTDRKDEAVQWYAAAVRTEPQLWRDPANFPRLLPDWRDSERATLAEVQAAWAANPPKWP